MKTPEQCKLIWGKFDRLELCQQYLVFLSLLMMNMMVMNFFVWNS